MTSVLEAHDVVASYGEGPNILNGASIEVEENESVCLIGPNGAGKSTLMKVVCGLLTPTQGRVFLGDADVTDNSMKENMREGMVFVPQGRSSFTNMTVRENLEMGGVLFDDDFVDERIDEVYDLFPILEERSGQSAGTLSGGQQQMLEMARGLVPDPDLLLLDEPSIGLAPKLREDVFEKVDTLLASGRTVLMVEQNVREGLDHSNRGYVLDQGETVLDGTADEILNNPRVQDLYLGGNDGDDVGVATDGGTRSSENR
jgi:branched-chain amino acid transport system ATP-binding protein